ncbi:hypothetical protein J6590_025149 [Homalodisca vitripennis]|nr:hypothetical protein J6590_025149 [Homalodisca vitripennis]
MRKISEKFELADGKAVLTMRSYRKLYLARGMGRAENRNSDSGEFGPHAVRVGAGPSRDTMDAPVECASASRFTMVLSSIAAQCLNNSREVVLTETNQLKGSQFPQKGVCKCYDTSECS